MCPCVPSPITFDLAVAENVQLRKDSFFANGGRLVLPVLAADAAVTIGQAMLRLYRHDALCWLWLSVIIFFALLSVALLRPWNVIALRLKPHIATTIRFGEAGITIESGAATKRAERFVPFAQIRIVRLTPSALIVAKRWALLAIIPKRVLADNGAELMQ